MDANGSSMTSVGGSHGILYDSALWKHVLCATKQPCFQCVFVGHCSGHQTYEIVIYSIVYTHSVNTCLTIELAASGRYQILSNRQSIKYVGRYCIIIRSSSSLSSF